MWFEAIFARVSHGLRAHSRQIPKRIDISAQAGLTLRRQAAVIRALPRPRPLRGAATLASSGQVAQLVEQGTENPRVGGSIPSLATIYFNDLRCVLALCPSEGVVISKTTQIPMKIDPTLHVVC